MPRRTTTTNQTPATVDFETENIERRPCYPPKPVGVAIKMPGKRGRYYSWGHPTQNNCTRAQAKRALVAAYKSPGGVLFFNAGFDLAVAEKFFQLRWPAWDRIHCSQILAFLHDPYSQVLGLKPLSEALLDMPPDEQDELRDWIVTHVPEAKAKFARSKAKRFNIGPWIYLAPGRLTGKYAVGDVDRTLGLFRFYKETRQSMPEPYERERRMLRVGEDMSVNGFPVDVPELERIHEDTPKQQERLDAALRKHLGVPRGFDLTKREALCDAIENAGVLSEWIPTKKGKRSLAHEDFALVCQDEKLCDMLHQRSLLATIKSTFIDTWLEMSQADGRVHVDWRLVRDSRGGARTGRVSSTPNVQNTTKEGPPKPAIRGLQIPNMRTVVKAQRGSRIGCPDYSQQEPRMAAHFAGGAIAQRYRDDPNLDFHVNTIAVMAAVGATIERDEAKTLGLAILYALGLDALALKLGVTRQQAGQLRKLFRTVVPEFSALEKELKGVWQADGVIITWGGRRVRCEAPKLINGRMRTWEYKALNYECQGSAGDQTKQAMIDYHEDPKREGHLILTVHDELPIEAPTKIIMRETKRLVRHMEAVGPFEVPFVADFGVGPTWWAAKP